LRRLVAVCGDTVLDRRVRRDETAGEPRYRRRPPWPSPAAGRSEARRIRWAVSSSAPSIRGPGRRSPCRTGAARAAGRPGCGHGHAWSESFRVAGRGDRRRLRGPRPAPWWSDRMPGRAPPAPLVRWRRCSPMAQGRRSPLTRQDGYGDPAADVTQESPKS